MIAFDPINRVARLDAALLRGARTRAHRAPLERIARGCSALGEHGAVWLALGALRALIDHRRRHDWIRATAVVAGAYGANQAIKLAIRRRRPELRGLPPLTRTLTRLSFPSAHATTSFAAARAYGPLSGPATRSAMPLAAGAIGLSRLYLGVHYPSDVIAGAALGWAIAAATDRRSRARGVGAAAAVGEGAP